MWIDSLAKVATPPVSSSMIPMLYGVPVAVPVEVVNSVDDVVVVLGDPEFETTVEGEELLVVVELACVVVVVDVRVIAYTPAARTMMTITAMITITDVFITPKANRIRV
jgi:hypothetical protein